LVVRNLAHDAVTIQVHDHEPGGVGDIEAMPLDDGVVPAPIPTDRDGLEEAIAARILGEGRTTPQSQGGEGKLHVSH
jgi:hypothetical protein